MNVSLRVQFVTSMLTVLTPMAVTSVPAELDTQEMVSIVVVRWFLNNTVFNTIMVLLISSRC